MKHVGNKKENNGLKLNNKIEEDTKNWRKDLETNKENGRHLKNNYGDKSIKKIDKIIN